MTPSHGVDRDWPEGPELIDLDDIGSAGVPYMERWGSTAPPADELLTRPEYLTKAQAGEIVQLHPKTIERAILDGELPAYKLREKVRIRRSDLEAWIERNRVEPSTGLHDI